MGQLFEYTSLFFSIGYIKKKNAVYEATFFEPGKIDSFILGYLLAVEAKYSCRFLISQIFYT